MNYKDTNENIMWSPITIDAAVYEREFTDNNVEIYYYQDPDYRGLNQDEAPANTPNDIIVDTDFKLNPTDRLDKLGNWTCRYRAEDGRVMYTKAEMVKYPLDKGKPNAVKCKTPIWDL
jgi:hypothetical protein